MDRNSGDVRKRHVKLSLEMTLNASLLFHLTFFAQKIVLIFDTPIGAITFPVLCVIFLPSISDAAVSRAVIATSVVGWSVAAAVAVVGLVYCRRTRHADKQG